MNKVYTACFEIKTIIYVSVDYIYDDNFKIAKLNINFGGLSLSAKYGKLEVNADSVSFLVQIKIKYLKVEIPKSVKLVNKLRTTAICKLLAMNRAEQLRF